MTTNQTIDGVPRELTPEMLNELTNGDASKRAVMKLRWASMLALLDSPTVESELSRMTRLCQNAELALKVQSESYEALKAAQPQREPVAWVECSPSWLKAGGDCATAPRLCVGRDGISHLHPAHAEQPAPVAVVLPERQEVDKYGEFYDSGWNDCLDEVTRLNKAKD